MDAPAFARVEKLAARITELDPELTALVFEGLDRFGHRRADDGVKVADSDDIAHCTADELAYANRLARVQTLVKAAASAYAVHTLLEEGIEKVAAGIADDVKHMSTELGGLPDRLIGSDIDNNKAVDFIGKATDTLGEKPELPVGDASPLDLPERQELANNDARISIEKLMGDEFIGKHPLHHVVDAFNRIRSVNPHLGEAELHNLVRQDLASGGDVPLDTLHRARKPHA